MPKTMVKNQADHKEKITNIQIGLDDAFGLLEPELSDLLTEYKALRGYVGDLLFMLYRGCATEEDVQKALDRISFSGLEEGAEELQVNLKTFEYRIKDLHSKVAAAAQDKKVDLKLDDLYWYNTKDLAKDFAQDGLDLKEFLVYQVTFRSLAVKEEAEERELYCLCPKADRESWKDSSEVTRQMAEQNIPFDDGSIWTVQSVHVVIEERPVRGV